MAYTTATLNTREPMVDLKRRPTKTFIDWVTQLVADVDASPARLQVTSVTGQTASISTTPIVTGSLATGLYRVTWYARVTTPATTGAATSSLTVTAGWTDGGVTCTYSGAAMTGNTTGTVQSQTLMVNVDAATPVTYATTYASNTAGQMVYKLSLVLEQVNA